MQSSHKKGLAIRHTVSITKLSISIWQTSAQVLNTALSLNISLNGTENKFDQNVVILHSHSSIVKPRQKASLVCNTLALHSSSSTVEGPHKSMWLEGCHLCSWALSFKNVCHESWLSTHQMQDSFFTLKNPWKYLVTGEKTASALIGTSKKNWISWKSSFFLVTYLKRETFIYFRLIYR